MQHFEGVNNFIDDSTPDMVAGATLIHCHSGVSRSVTLCLAYMIGRLGYDLHQAIEEVNLRRRESNPNLGFIGQLYRYQRQVKIQLDEVMKEQSQTCGN